MESKPIYTLPGGIRTYLYLLQHDRHCLDAIDFISLAHILKDG
jgi:hypothetical protein